MAGSFRFWLVKFASHPLRGEVLNVGLLLEQNGRFEVRAGHRLEKIRAISAAVDPADVYAELAELPSLLGSSSIENVETVLSKLSFLRPEFKGTLSPGSEDLVEHYVGDLLARYVDSEPAPPKPVRKRPTRLRQEIRMALMSEHILARPSEGLDSHRVLYKHRLSEGVEADFVLKNGAMHVVESVDATSENVTLQKCLYEIAMSTLTFEHARISFGNNCVRPRLVYNASSDLENALRPSLYAAEHQGAEVINWASSEARLKFLETLSALAETTHDIKAQSTLFSASTIPQRKLN